MRRKPRRDRRYGAVAGTTSSGFMVDYRLDSAEQIAEVLATKQSLGLHGGMLITNPIPIESAFDSDTMNQHIEQAQAEANEQGISGKEITPFLLQRIFELSNGASLEANVQLILNNAHLGAQIALAMAKLESNKA